MPLPKTKKVGKVISFLNKENPNMPQKQKIAIALNQTGKSNRKAVAGAFRRKFSKGK